MKTVLAAIMAFGAVGAVATARQDSPWDKRELGGGAVEFRLENGEDAVVILTCQPRGVGVGFEFPTPLEDTERATLRGIPGDRQNVAVARVSERVFRISSGGGRDTALRLLRDAARFFVRVAGKQATFNILGSNAIVSECLNQQDEAIGNPTRRD